MTIKQSDAAKNLVCLCGCGKQLKTAGKSGYAPGHYPRTLECKEKGAASHRGKPLGPHTDDWKEMMRQRMAGENNPRFGVKWSDEERAAIVAKLAALPKTPEWYEHISQAKKGKLPYPTALEVLARYNQPGETHSCWQGGLSFEPYPPAFNDKFKQMIRKRDGGRCVLCGQPGKEVHHINYVKNDTNPDNCVTLCKHCHGKTNHNRDIWLARFAAVLRLAA